MNLTAHGWAEQAACREYDPELFYPATTGRRRRERAIKRVAVICRHCPVALQCLTEAIRNDEQFGIWGGRDFEKVRRP